MPETPYPENEHDRLPPSGHSAAWHQGFSDYYKHVVVNFYTVDSDYGSGWLAAQVEDEAVDGSPLDIGA